jgi:very-short-patch-repair endonuclease
VATRAELLAVAVRAAGHRGAGVLQRAVERLHEPAMTRSGAERRLLRLIRSARLPRRRVNTRLRGYEVDFHWPDADLVVEVDGFAYHSGRHAFERDRRRDADLGSAGTRVLRVTYRQIIEEPEAVIAHIAGALAARRRAH